MLVNVERDGRQFTLNLPSTALLAGFLRDEDQEKLVIVLRRQGETIADTIERAKAAYPGATWQRVDTEFVMDAQYSFGVVDGNPDTMEFGVIDREGTVMLDAATPRDQMEIARILSLLDDAR